MEKASMPAIKGEPGVDDTNKKAKPKFVPKAPPKKAPTATLTDAKSVAPTSFLILFIFNVNIVAMVKILFRRAVDFPTTTKPRDMRRDPRHDGGRQSQQGRGRGRWITPTGASFFTGNSSHASQTTSMGSFNLVIGGNTHTKVFKFYVRLHYVIECPWFLMQAHGGVNVKSEGTSGDRKETERGGGHSVKLATEDQNIADCEDEYGF